MSELPRDDEYVTLLRGRLPDDAHKARMRARLAAAGVGGAALAAGSAHAAVGTAWKLSLVSKVFLAAGGVAVLGGSAYLATAVTESPRVERTVIVPAQPDVAEPAPAAARAPVEPVVVEPAPVTKKPRKPGTAIDTLSAENALLAEAVRALNAGDAAEAERLLDEHEHRHPDGVLRDERQRARRRLLQQRGAGTGAGTPR